MYANNKVDPEVIKNRVEQHIEGALGLGGFGVPAEKNMGLGKVEKLIERQMCKMPLTRGGKTLEYSMQKGAPGSLIPINPCSGSALDEMAVINAATEKIKASGGKRKRDEMGEIQNV